MQISFSALDPLQSTSDLLALGCDEEALADLSLLDRLDTSLSGALRQAIAEERFKGKPGQSLVLTTHGRLPTRRIALLGMGPRSSLNGPALRSFAGRAVRIASGVGAGRVALVPPAASFASPGLSLAAAAQLLSEGANLGQYKFDRYLAEEKRAPRSVTQVELHAVGTNTPGPDAAPAVARGARVAAAIALARDLVNEPAGVLTPSRLADIAVKLAGEHKLEAKVLGPTECRQLGMNLYLAVAQGSPQEPRFVHLTWRPANPKRRVVIIGKGVTFDSGGLSLKPNDGMLDMKTDMAGAAAVLSVMPLLAEEALPIEVHALAACTENMISGSAYKLGDVIRSKAGKTVEINNTDAEGRLTLADAISYGLELKPDYVLDFATLTGACMVALGPHIAGVMSNNEGLSNDWLAAAKGAGEEMWPLPLPDRLFDQLKSEIADMKNTGERWGGALTAGLFLKEFVGNTPWVHVDLAGPSTADKENGPVTKGGTGFGVASIFEFLRRLADR